MRTQSGFHRLCDMRTISDIRKKHFFISMRYFDTKMNFSPEKMRLPGKNSTVQKKIAKMILEKRKKSTSVGTTRCDSNPICQEWKQSQNYRSPIKATLFINIQYNLVWRMITDSNENTLVLLGTRFKLDTLFIFNRSRVKISIF